MITHLRGRLVEKNPTNVVIDCGGVGYFLHISLHTYSKIPESENVQLLTHLIVREDAHTLFGFADADERHLFRQLITVSGVGAATARTMLSSLSPDDIRNAIAGGDVSTFRSVKGIGAKTAQRIIIDLKDKISSVASASDVLNLKGNTSKEEALSALETLGFSRKPAEKACMEILREHPGATSETIIKLALKKL